MTNDGGNMKEYIKRFYTVITKAGLYLNLFFAFHYIFRNEQISTAIIPVYFLFFIFVCFIAFLKKKLKLDGRLHLFWILGSALLFNYIFQEYQVKLVLSDYLYIVFLLFFVSLCVSLFRFDSITKKTHTILMTLFLIVFVSVFLLAIYWINEPYMWLFVLLLYKLIPYVFAYHISKMYALSFDKVYFLILFLPFILILNAYTLVTGTLHMISIKDLVNEHKE